MTLTDLLGKGVRSVALGLSVLAGGYGCGGGGTSEDKYTARCEQLCTRVWKECNGLPEANYSLGYSYGDCVARCPAFLEIVDGFMDSSLTCVINTNDCQQLEEDVCQMDEGDLFQKYI